MIFKSGKRWRQFDICMLDKSNKNSPYYNERTKLIKKSVSEWGKRTSARNGWKKKGLLIKGELENGNYPEKLACWIIKI